jgi:hypothetical protein
MHETLSEDKRKESGGYVVRRAEGDGGQHEG